MKGRMEPFFYVTVGCGMALATSVFTMISGLFEVVGGLGVLLGIALAGLFCLVIALSIGELASMYPSAPAIRTYLKTAFGDRVSLVLVYLYLISVILVAGLESFIFSQVFQAVFPNAATIPTVLSLIGVVLAVNLAGLDLPRSTQMITTVLAVMLIATSGVYGLVMPKIDFSTSIGAQAGADLLLTLPAASGMAIFLFMGFEWVTPLGMRPKSYQWHVPVSMPIAVGVLVITFELFVLGAASQLPRSAIASTPIPHVPYLATLYGPVGVYLALGLALLATISTFNAGIMGGSRLIYMLAREGNLPGWCASISLRTSAPVGSILLLGGSTLASAIVVVTWRIEVLVAVIGAAIMCVIYAAFLLAALVLRKRRPEAARPFRSPVWSPIQWAGVIVLPFMGLQTLFSQPDWGVWPVLGTGAAVTLAALLAWRYRTASRQEPRGNQAPLVVSPEPGREGC